MRFDLEERLDASALTCSQRLTYASGMVAEARLRQALFLRERTIVVSNWGRTDG